MRNERMASDTESCAEHMRFTARCAFEILGVTMTSHATVDVADEKASAGDASQDRMINSLVDALEPEQKVTFVYEGGGSTPLKWQIVGEAASAESTAHAGQHLLNINKALLTVLESRKASYRYKAVDTTVPDKTKTAPHRWTGSLQPQGTLIRGTGAAIGFGAHVADVPTAPASVCLPHYVQDRARAFSSLISLLSSSQIPLRISISLAACRLTRKQEMALKSALDVILDRRADSDIAAHIENTANVWLKTITGCRITCAVTSSEPVSEPFMRMLGAEIYHGPVDIICHPASDPSAGPLTLAGTGSASLLDLRDCIPSSVQMPPLFPQPEVLVRHGMRRFFNRDTPAISKDGCLMGSVGDGMAEQAVRLAQSVRSQHTYILGACGTGKSTLLFNMIMQDIHAGKGVCLVDPHGDLYAQILRAMPAHRADDVVLLDPQDRTRAVGINLLDCEGPHHDVQANFVVNEMLSMLNKLFDMRLCGGPMFELYFRNALQLVMSIEGAPGTLVDVSAVFEHKAFRDKLLKYGKNPLHHDFWKMAENVNGDHRLANMAPYIVSKLNAFIHNPILRPIIGQPKTTINIRQIMDKRQILLVNLCRGAMGELDMRLMGMIVLTKIICAAMSRMNIAANRRQPFMLYVDEFQNFTTDATASLLSESRKFGLCLTLAHQNLTQLTENGNDNVVHSVLGNTGSMVLFRLGAPDADKLAIYTRPQFGPQDLQSLPNYHAAARLLTPTGPTQAFVFQTNPAVKPQADTGILKQIKKNQIQYTGKIKDIEEMLRQRREHISGEKTPEEKLVDTLLK